MLFKVKVGQDGYQSGRDMIDGKTVNYIWRHLGFATMFPPGITNI